MEKARALVALEAHAEGLFEGRADGVDGRRVARGLDTREAVAGIGREQPSQVLWLGQSGLMGQRATEILSQARADFAGECARLFQRKIERGLAVGQTEGLEHRTASGRVRADEHEVARVRYQHPLVAAPVAVHLIAVRDQPRVIASGLDLDNAALGSLPFPGSPLLQLLGRVEAEVGARSKFENEGELTC